MCRMGKKGRKLDFEVVFLLLKDSSEYFKISFWFKFVEENMLENFNNFFLFTPVKCLLCIFNFRYGIPLI